MKFSKKYRMPASKVDYDFNLELDITDPIVQQQTVVDTATITGVIPLDPVVVIPPPPPPRSNLILNMDFSKGSLPAASALSMQPPNRFAINVVNGVQYCHITCNDTDPLIVNANRSEFNVPTNKAEAFKDGVVRKYGLRYLLPASYIADVSPELIFQQHEFSGSASPHFALWTKDGHWYPAINGQQDLNADLGAYEFNKPTDFVFDVLWSSKTNGSITIYKNGKIVKVYTGANMPVDTKIPYMKCGLYKWDWAKNPGRSKVHSRDLYIGAIYIGNENSTLADVTP